MSIPAAWPPVLDSFGTPLVLGPSPGQLSRDAGHLPVRQFDQRIDNRFVANYFRLCSHAAAVNLLVRLRRFTADPLPALAPPAETAPPTSQATEAVTPAEEAGVPVEALTGAARQSPFRLRRQRDPLGEGHPCTWRTLLIKVAAEVVVRTRRIVVRLCSTSKCCATWRCSATRRRGQP
jgi:hypothetical protein